MVNKTNQSKTVRMICRWGHFSFRQTFIRKAKFFRWCELYICQEDYTLKTCNECGTILTKLGTSKVFQCPKCKHVVDRDMHAARDIHLRYLSKDMI
mmetsp:Transcript_7214/g.12844  ORF Transcript_7214/g.12844 Transcript_7214/m.12844 type:complete len:96 (+) Transcript_7214:1462-1749(+)